MFLETNNRRLNEYIHKVASLAPGEAICFAVNEMTDDISSREYNGGRWNPADRVLENIIGSGHGWSYRLDEQRECVTFYRSKSPPPDGSYTYVDPDRRVFFDMANGLYQSKYQPDATQQNAGNGTV